MHNHKSLLLVFFALILGNVTQAQTASNFMESNGKIYVVMAVVLIIVLGLFIYLAVLDKKLKNLEK